MTAIQQQAIQLIKRLPDAKIQAIITLAADELSLLDYQQSVGSGVKKHAFDSLEKLDIDLPSDFNADDELATAIGEKYGFVG